MGVGEIHKHGKNAMQFRIFSIKDLAIVINHFDKYPLITQK
jgi:LAGLIDADG endonuclease